MELYFGGERLLPEKKKSTVAVVGAGPGGLAVAMLLASRGYHVTVFEKNDSVGGRTSRLELGEYTFDRGPTFLMMPHLLEELFAYAGADMHQQLRLVELDPMYRLVFGEQELLATRSPARMKERIDSFSPGDGDGYLRFMLEEENKFKMLEPLLRRPFNGVFDYARRDVLRALPKLSLGDTVYSRLARYFKDERLRFAFSFQAKYLGMSPWECPGAFTILSFMEHRYGLYHPMGGVFRTCEAMADVFRGLGGQLHTSCGVKQVRVRERKAVGLLLENGEELAFDDIVINADFGTAASRLFAPGDLRKYSPDKVSRLRYSCSAFMLYMGVNRPVRLPHHNVYFARDYRRNTEEVCRYGVVSDDFSFYVHNPSALDPTLAPPGKSSLYVLVPVPNTGCAMEWNEETTGSFRESVLRKLEQEPELAGITRDIETELIATPRDWEQQLNVYRGATFNLSHRLSQMMAFRPHNRFEDADRCWLVGGGTHPGSGLPTIWESARITASMMAARDGKEPFGLSASVAAQGLRP
jgi:phytoene desaturase